MENKKYEQLGHFYKRKVIKKTKPFYFQASQAYSDQTGCYCAGLERCINGSE